MESWSAITWIKTIQSCCRFCYIFTHAYTRMHSCNTTNFQKEVNCIKLYTRSLIVYKFTHNMVDVLVVVVDDDGTGGVKQYRSIITTRVKILHINFQFESLDRSASTLPLITSFWLVSHSLSLLFSIIKKYYFFLHD